MPLRLAKFRPDTLDALDVLAKEHHRSRPDVAHALACLATGEDKATIEWMLVAELAKIKPLQALRGTGRRARRAAEREAAHDTADIVTDEQIDRLHTEAGNVRDEAQVRLCERALDDDKEARRECARVIQAALAMVD